MTSALRHRLARYAAGVHRLREPAHLLDAELPSGMAEVYRELDGGELFHEFLVLYPSREVKREEGMYGVGEIGSDELWVDAESGAVWRLEGDTGELIPEGTRLDRWLAGYIDAEAVLYSEDGEFREGVFTEEGELGAEAAARRERVAVKRDRRAAGPRWRLAKALAQQGRLEEARDELEEVVALSPSFGWAFFDLARLSESLGDVEAARADAEEAARVDPDPEHAGLFWAHAARLAARLGDEEGRARAAEAALAAMPELASAQREGAAERLEAGFLDEARELVDVALALNPRELTALELRRRIAETPPTEGPETA